VDANPSAIPTPEIHVDESAAATSATASGGSDDIVASPIASGQSEEPEETDMETGTSDEPFDPFNESVNAPPREEHNVRFDRTTLVKAASSTVQDDLDLADPDQVLRHKLQIVTSGGSPKMQRKNRKLTNMFKSRRRKEDQVEQMIGIDNDAFFLGQQAAEAMAFKPKHPDEEPAYFDDLSPEQQAAYEKRVSVIGGEGDMGLFDPFADVQEVAQHNDDSDDNDDNDATGVAAALAAGSPDKADKADPAPAPLADVDEFGDEADDFLAELPPSKFTPAATGGWKRSLSGKHLVAAEPEPDASSTDHDTLSLDGTEEESSTDSSRSRKLLSGFKSFKNKLRGSKHKSDKPETDLLGPAGPVVQPKMDFVAREMRMTDAQRIAVMSMVRDGKLSIEAAIRKVCLRRRCLIEELRCLNVTCVSDVSHPYSGLTGSNGGRVVGRAR
jgi:hypothetical protein